MDTLNSLRLFIETVQEGSLSAAARKNGISPATVSRSIDGLETELGFQLFSKSSRQIGLTEAGASYLPYVMRILPELDNAAEFARGFHSEAKGLLKVHARMAIGDICIAPLIQKFLVKYPDIDVQLTLSNDVEPDMIREHIDVDIRTGVLQDSSLIARKLADSHRLIIASPEYLKKYGTPKTPTDLEHHNCITFKTGPNPVFWRFRDAAGHEIGIEPKGRVIANSGSIVRYTVRSGNGIGHMTDWAVARDLQAGNLVQILGDYEVTVDKFYHGVYAVFLPNRDQSVKVRCLIDFLAREFKDMSFLTSMPDRSDFSHMISNTVAAE